MKLEPGVFSQWDNDMVLSWRDLSKSELHNMFVDVCHGTNKGDF